MLFVEEKRTSEKSRCKLQLVSGEQLPYLGDRLPLTVVRENRKNGKVKRIGERVIMTVPYEADALFRGRLIEKWYRQEALYILSEKATEFASRLFVQYKKIYIKDQKSCWGSCSSKGNLNFNWRILLAPEPVCDYVVIHELCHLVHMNHSGDFWALVETLCPDYKQYRKWLKDQIWMMYPF